MKPIGYFGAGILFLLLAPAPAAFAQHEQTGGKPEGKPAAQQPQEKSQRTPAEQHPQLQQRPKPQPAMQRPQEVKAQPQIKAEERPVEAKVQPRPQDVKVNPQVKAEERPVEAKVQPRPQEVKVHPQVKAQQPQPPPQPQVTVQQPQSVRPEPQAKLQGEQRGRAVWQERRARDWKTEHRDWAQRGGYSGFRIPEDRYDGFFGPDHSFRISGDSMVVIGGYPRFQYDGYWFSVVDPWPEYWSESWYSNDDVYLDFSGDGYYLHNRRFPEDRIAVIAYVG
jgi:hypothetical protein